MSAVSICIHTQTSGKLQLFGIFADLLVTQLMMPERLQVKVNKPKQLALAGAELNVSYEKPSTAM